MLDSGAPLFGVTLSITRTTALFVTSSILEIKTKLQSGYMNKIPF